MFSKRKRVTTITISLLSLLVLSIAPVYLGSTAAAEDFAEPGDVLKYKVTEFNIDFSNLNDEPDNPFEFDDPNMLEDSVLYYKVLNVRFDLTFAVGFILGKQVEVQLDKSADFGPEIDPDLLPEFIILPEGAGVPFFGGEYDLDEPFSYDLEPDALPVILDPSGDWEEYRDMLVETMEPTRAELTDDFMTAEWEQALSSDEEGIEKGIMQWDRESGILVLGEVHGQQQVGDDISPIDIKIEFGNKNHYGMPSDAKEGAEFNYDLTVLDFYHDGFKEIAGTQMVDGIEQTMLAMQGETILTMEIKEIDGLFYEFEATLFPNNPQFKQGPDMGEGMAFGLGIPFLTPDWGFYTSVMATGNLVIDTFTSLVGAVRPTTDMPEFDIDQLMFEMQVSKENGYRYFGFELGEEVEIEDPDSMATVYTKTDGNAWLAYTEEGVLEGFFFTMMGMIETEGNAEGQDIKVDYEFTAKVERSGVEVADPEDMAEPRFTEPPSLEDLKKGEEIDDGGEPGAFVPGFDTIAAFSALVGLSAIVVRKRKKA